MATIVNDRDVLLQGASTRDVDPRAGKFIKLTPTTPVFKVATGGTALPTSISLTAEAVNIPGGTITFSVTGGATYSQSGNTVTMTLAQMPVDSVTFTASITDLGQTYTTTQVIAKVYDGSNGTPGTNGTDGARGAGHYYATGSSWSDATADAATPGANVLNDVVTISNGSTFVSEKIWTGSAWVANGVVIDGSLIVNGSVTAAKVNANGLSIRKSDGTLILDASGGGLQSGFEAPGTLNSAIKLGGRNFLLNSQYMQDVPNSAGKGTAVLRTDETTPYYRITATSDVSTYNTQYLYPKITVGTQCVISCEVRITSTGSVGFYNGLAMQAVPANVWTKIFYVFTYTGSGRETGHTYSGLVLDYRNYKVEIGNIPTDWTPAPEDVDSATAAAALTATAAGMDVGLGINLLTNSLPNNLLRLTTAGTTGITPEGGGVQMVLKGNGNGWDVYSPLRQCALIHFPTAGGTPANGTYQNVYFGEFSRTPVTPGKRYEFSVFASGHRCTNTVFISWYAADGTTFVANSAVSASTTYDNEAQYYVVPFPRPTLFAVAPAGAYYALPTVTCNYGGAADPYSFISGWYFGEALAVQTVNSAWSEGSPVDPRSIGYTGDLNASLDINLIGTNVTLAGNTATKTGGSNSVWDAGVRSKDSAPNGAVASFVIPNTTSYIMFGLNGSDAATDSGYLNIDYAIYPNPGGVLNIYEGGSPATGTAYTYAAGDVLSVVDDGSSIKYLVNGAVIFTSQAAASKLPNKNLYLDSSIYQIGNSMKNIQFFAQTSNNFANVGGTTRPANNATNDVALVASSGMSLVGNAAYKIVGGGAWDQQVYSTNGYTNGAHASAQIYQGSLFIGLNTITDITDPSYTGIDIGMYCQGDGALYAFLGSTNIATLGTWAVGDTVEVQYTGAYYYWTKNGTILNTLAASPGIKYFFDSSFNEQNSSITTIKFGPMTSNNFADVGGTTRPSDNASSDVALAGTNVTIVGNTATKTGGAGATWGDAQVYSVNGYTAGAIAEARIPSVSYGLMFGLNQDPTTDSNYSSLDYAWWVNGASGSYYESNVSVTAGAVTLAVGDVLAVVSDNVNVYYLQNGVVRRTVAISAPNLKMYFDSSFNSLGASLTNIRFGPMSNVADGANALLAVNNATTGLAQRMRLNADNILGGIISANVVSAPAGFRAGNVTWNAAGAWVSGSGVAMTPTGLVGYNSSGVAQFSINASTGAAVFAGALSAASGSFAGSLSAVTGTFGSLTVASGGSISSGQSAYNTGTGFWLGIVSGTPKFSIGNSSGNQLTWDGTTLNYIGSVVLPPFSLAITGVSSLTTSTSNANITGFSMGTITAVPTGGRGTITYAWTAVTSETSPTNRTGLLSALAPTSAATAVRGKVSNIDTSVTGVYIVTATDADNRVATAVANVTLQFGTAS